MARSFTHDPDAVLDYKWDWSAMYPDDTITSHTVTAAAGITVDSSEAIGMAVTAWLSGGSVGQSYTVTCHIATAAGREDDRTIGIIVQER